MTNLEDNLPKTADERSKCEYYDISLGPYVVCNFTKRAEKCPGKNKCVYRVEENAKSKSL